MTLFLAKVELFKSRTYLENGSKCGKIEVKYFEVPPYKIEIQYTRYNHAKFMVTDNTVYIGTVAAKNAPKMHQI